MFRPKEFYQDSGRRQKWSSSLKKTNLCGAIEFSKRQKTLESLVLCKYTRSKLLDDLSKKPLHEILKELKQLGVVFPKKAVKILLESIPKEQIDKINKERKRKKISTLAKKQFENVEFVSKTIAVFEKTKGYRSKGEQRLRYWLIENFDEYDWGSKHLIFQNKIYEFDIFSRKFDDFYIEYNGIIHYKPIYSQQKLEEIRKKDILKKEIAFLMKKKFIVIKDIWPFDKQIEIVRNFLSS